MSLIGRLANTRQIKNVNIIANGLHTSSTWHADLKWREKRRLPQNPNAFGPLTNLPDYSYADGRPAPFGVKQWGRIQEQREILGKVKTLVHEIDDAVTRHARFVSKQAEKNTAMIEAKLKPKGQCSLNDENPKS